MSGNARIWHSSHLRTMLLAVGYIAAWWGLWQAATWFNLVTGVSLWYPPAGLTFAILLAFGWRGLPLPIVASLLAGLSIWSWDQWPYYLLANLITPLGYALAAYALKKYSDGHPHGKWRFDNPQQVALFLGAATGGALFAALAGAQILDSAGLLPPAQSRSEVVLGWWVGDLSGVVTFAPLVLLFVAPLAWRFREGKRLHPPQSLTSIERPPLRLVVFQGVLSVLLLVAVFWAPHHLLQGQLDPFMILLLLPVLAWIITTCNMRGAVLTVFVYELGIVAMVGLLKAEHVLQYQIVMVVVATSGLLTGAVSHAKLISIARFRDLAEVSNDWLWEFDANGRLGDLSGPLLKTVRLRDNQLGTSWWDYVIPQERDNDLAVLKVAIEQRWPFQQLALRIQLPGQEQPIWTRSSGKPLFDEDGEFLGYRGASTDITDHKRIEALLHDYDKTVEAKIVERTRALTESSQRNWQLANFDSLTGLPNRNLLFERLIKSLQQAQRHGRLLAVLLVDLDGFKEVNDTLGHETGDELLRQIAKRLQRCVRATDTVARLGGDEFTIILPELEQPKGAAVVAQNIVNTLSAPVLLGKTGAVVTASIGIALYQPEWPATLEAGMTLLRQADVAMYAAKRVGKNTWHFADKATHSSWDDPLKPPSAD
ncbi:MAG: diguanylate cyclase [Candidatus Competibacteraceae bacterium]